MPNTLENDLSDLNDQIGLTFSENRLKVAHIEPLLCKSYMDHRQSGRGRQYLPSEGRGNDLLSPIYRGQVISTFSFPPAQQHLHEILTGTEFTSNVTSLIVYRGQQVPGCKGEGGQVAPE